MTPEDFQRVEAVFQGAVGLAGTERDAYLANACAGDETLRGRVDTLLSRDAAPHHLLALEPCPAAEHDHTELPLPATIGPYRILGVLGAGSMGVVYRAQQEHPQRLVALKLMRSGLTSARAMRRFRLESELLAQLQHPGVAGVIEAGTTVPDGQVGHGAQPYFVMELIEGRPLLEYVRHHQLSHRARIELLVRVCEAVDHAHLHGIVHRDLKPANILVTEVGTGSTRGSRDGGTVGQPKVLDFGVARIMHGERMPGTAPTRAGELVGTMPYMSPEQISGDPESVDTRCDVYALGIILFEMLTGRRPHDVGGASLAEAARRICEEPATRVGTIDRRLRGDLDTIVATALERDLSRRYGSVAAFAGDLRRYLDDEPILARRPTTLYQLGKFARRNRGFVAGVVIALVVLAGGLVASATLYARSEARAELMRRSLYAQRIIVAATALDAGDVRRIPELLSECPPDLRHWEWDRLRLLVDRSARVLRGHTGLVNEVCFTPDGEHLLTAGGYDQLVPRVQRESSARLWDARTGALLHTFAGHANSVGSVAVSPDGAWLGTLTRTHPSVGEPAEGRLRLWSLSDRTVRRTREIHAEFGAGLAFAPDGSALYTAGALGHLACLRTADLEVVWRTGAPALATGLALSPAGDLLAGSLWSGEVTVCRTATGEVVWSREPHGPVPVLGLAISPDGRALATASKDRTVRVLDLSNGAEQFALPDVGARVTAVAYGPRGHLFTGAADGVIRVYDAHAGERLDTLLGHEDVVRFLAVSRDGGTLASAGGDGTARLWDLDAPPPDTTWRPHGANEVNWVAWHPDRALLATAGDDAHARVIDLDTGAQVLAVAHEDDRYVTHVSWSRDATRLLTLGSRGDMRLWDARSGKLIAAWSVHPELAFCAAFDPQATRIATGARGALDVWDGHTGAPIAALRPGATDVLDVAWSPDGVHLAAADQDGRVTLWSPGDGADPVVLVHAEVPMECVAFHPRQPWLACGDRAGNVHVVDWQHRDLVYRVKAHTAPCEAVAFSPDGARLLAGDADGAIRLLESATGAHLMTLDEHRSGVVAAAFSPDGRRIASVSRDFTARVWNAAPR